MKSILKSSLVLFFISGLLFSCSPRQPVPEIHVPPPSGRPSTGTLSDQNPQHLSSLRRAIVETAIKSIGTSYRWGGSTPRTGFDCSGLVRYTHQKARLPLPRTARRQFKNGHPVSLDQLKPADLVFFNNSSASKTYHVGIYIGNGVFVHAPGKGKTVRKARLNNPYFKTKFIGSRTYIPDTN